MQSRAADVDAYLDEVPPERRELLAKMRALCLETLAGHEESIAYGVPSYARDGEVEVAFASQKNMSCDPCWRPRRSPEVASAEGGVPASLTGAVA